MTKFQEALYQVYTWAPRRPDPNRAFVRDLDALIAAAKAGQRDEDAKIVEAIGDRRLDGYPGSLVDHFIEELAQAIREGKD